jgi:hypothetical protein
MSLEAQIQNLESLDINPDEIENKKYSEAFRLLFSIIELQNEKIENLNSENQKLRDENNWFCCKNNFTAFLGHNYCFLVTIQPI